MNRSIVNPSIILTKYQIEILSLLENNNIFISAPTSFGKTFILLEYIFRNKEKIDNIVIIVPTLALMNELLKKIYNLFSDEYNICINSEEELKEKNIFVFVPERSDSNFLKITDNLNIDLLIFDEIYKLRGVKKDINSDDRLIYMNKVYLDLVNKAKKIALLGPYINNVEFKNTNLNIIRYYTNYMPVYNKIDVLSDDTRWEHHITSKHDLVYFNAPESIYKNISGLLNLIPENDEYKEMYINELDYLEEVVGNNWYVIDLLKRGIGIHHGKTPIFLRKFYENEYNSGRVTALLCTKTLMEGINTPTESLIIVDKPKTSFELNNLIGRVGRLNIKNPIVGKILLCDKSILGNVNNTETWLDLTILAEDEIVYTDEEVLYLNKEYKDDNKKKEYIEKLEWLEKEHNVTKSLLIENNVEFGKAYSFFKNGIYNKFRDCTRIYDCIVVTTELISGPSYQFKKDKYNNLNLEIDYLPYKIYLNDILNGKTFKEIISRFNAEYNPTFDIGNINIFIDALYSLNNYIKFRFSKIINYLDLLDKNSLSEIVQNFISLVSSFNNMEIAYKILDDLGIDNNDSSKIISLLKINKNISTSDMIRLLKENLELLLKSDISPFTKNNIKNL